MTWFEEGIAEGSVVLTEFKGGRKKLYEIDCH